ncbi:hypothetical protein Zmor_010058 [Zophobas morio]|uniref:Uncharacterized protein n=1 Tax=Zophobas morio TaxID=2755281 RepID=A0AA38MJI7_9CUCU|nr:hypothetical protein Zmor_010058 [Zophobas morio]
MLLLKFLLLTNVCLVTSYKILCLFPHRGKSHFEVARLLIGTLAHKGHEVTLMSHFPLTTTPPNFTHILLRNSSVFVNVLDMHQYQGHRTEKWFFIRDCIINYAETSCEYDFSSPTVQHFLENCNTDFDVILTHVLSHDCFYSFARKFQAPIVGILPVKWVTWVDDYFGNPTHPAYVGNVVMDYGKRLWFFERVENFIIGIMHIWWHKNWIAERGHDIAKKYFGADVPPFQDFAMNMSLLLVYQHFSLNFPRPLVPGVVEVGGMHIGPTNDLPKVGTFLI